MLARIKVIIRRAKALPPNQQPAATDSFVFGAWTLKTGERELIDKDGVRRAAFLRRSSTC
ncbi:MAG: hypothetical protein WDN76_03410 [Alphaproteobacteria bacterium]